MYFSHLVFRDWASHSAKAPDRSRATAPRTSAISTRSLSNEFIRWAASCDPPPRWLPFKIKVPPPQGRRIASWGSYSILRRVPLKPGLRPMPVLLHAGCHWSVAEPLSLENTGSGGNREGRKGRYRFHKGTEYAIHAAQRPAFAANPHGWRVPFPYENDIAP